MKHYKIIRLSLGALLLAFSLASVAQLITWESYKQAGQTAYDQGNYAEAERQWSAALKRAEAFGPQDWRLATSLTNLAALYHTQGKYTEAEPFYKRTLAIAEQNLGPEHPDVATMLNLLGMFYHAQGKYAEAEPLYKRALAIEEKVLGQNHPNVVTVLENYAMLLRMTNRQMEATAMEARAKAIRAKQAQ